MADEPIPTDDARRRLASELRRAMHLVVSRDLRSEHVEELCATLAPLLDVIESLPQRGRSNLIWDGPGGISPPADGDAFADSVFRPVSGSGNPFSVPMTMYRQGDGVVSTVTLGAAFEGAPGRSHGGFVSAIFDDLLGSLPMMQRKIAFTASLTVNYVAPSPLYEPVVYRGWIDRVEGKKVFVAGDARHGDVVVSTATALFIDATEAMAGLYAA